MSGREGRGASAAAGARVALSIADFLVRTEQERLRLFRSYLNATVGSISPLLAELSLLEGIRIDEAAARIQPPPDWPWRAIWDDPVAMLLRIGRRASTPAAPADADRKRFRRVFADPGLVIRDAGHPRGRFGIRPCRGMLGFTADLGPATISAFGGTAHLRLPEGIPDTLLSSLAGRRIDGIVDHPLFRGTKYRIVRVQPDGAGMPVLVFRAKPVPFSFPLEEAGS